MILINHADHQPGTEPDDCPTCAVLIRCAQIPARATAVAPVLPPYAFN